MTSSFARGDETFRKFSEEGETVDCIKTSKRVPKKHIGSEKCKFCIK